MTENTYVATQIRLAPEVYDYLRAESGRMGISLNALMNMLIDDGRRLKEARITLHPQEPQSQSP